MVASCIALLPMRDENYVRRNFYYVVTHNWEERNSNGEFKVPCTITSRMILNASTHSLGLSMKQTMIKASSRSYIASVGIHLCNT
jgi:hypothetical protein